MKKLENNLKNAFSGLKKSHLGKILFSIKNGPKSMHHMLKVNYLLMSLDTSITNRRIKDNTFSSLYQCLQKQNDDKLS